jgi:hypothetical protein
MLFNIFCFITKQIQYTYSNKAVHMESSDHRTAVVLKKTDKKCMTFSKSMTRVVKKTDR